jgi:hypothetical protein
MNRRGSRCRMVIWHLVINWLTYNLTLYIILKNTAQCFDNTEYATLAAMGIVTLGLGVMQYDIWKTRHDTSAKIDFLKVHRRRKGDSPLSVTGGVP